MDIPSVPKDRLFTVLLLPVGPCVSIPDVALMPPTSAISGQRCRRALSNYLGSFLPRLQNGARIALPDFLAIVQKLDTRASSAIGAGVLVPADDVHGDDFLRTAVSDKRESATWKAIHRWIIGERYLPDGSSAASSPNEAP